MIFHNIYISSIETPNLFLLGGFLCRLLGNKVWHVRGVCSRCYTLQSKRCYGISNVKLKPVSHKPCGNRAPVCEDKFLGFVRQPHGVVNNTARLPYEKQGPKAAETNF